LLFSSPLFVVSVLGCLVGSPFSFVVCMLCDHCCLSWFFLGSGSLGGPLLVFLVLWKSWFFLFFFLLLLYLVLVVFICFEYTELLPGWLTSEAFAGQMLR